MSNTEYIHDIYSLSQLLGQGSGHCYCIPNYQRINVWAGENIQRFLSDMVDGISGYMRHLEGGAQSSDMFIGTMIFAQYGPPEETGPYDNSDWALSVRKVVDGQQRLTAMCMACTALYDFLKDKQDYVANLDGVSERISARIGVLTKDLVSVVTLDRISPRIISLNNDRWPGKDYSGQYRSPLARHLAEYCAEGSSHSSEEETLDKTPHASFKKAMKVMRKTLKDICETGSFEDHALPDVLGALSNESFKKFMSQLPATSINMFRADDKTMQHVYRAMMLGHFLLLRVKMMWMEATTEDVAIDIFESLNATGIQLTSIETFKPAVVLDLGEKQYGLSREKEQFDALENCIGTGEVQRAKFATETVASLALAETGLKLPNHHIRAQRDFLRTEYGKNKDRGVAIGTTQTNTFEFIRQMRCCGELVASVLDKKATQIGCIELEDEDMREGLQMECGAGFSFAYLQALRHSSCTPVLSRLYHQLTASIMSNSAGEISDKAVCAMCNSVKCVAAYYALMRLMGNATSAIDAAHKSYMLDFARTRDKSEVNAIRIRDALATRLATVVREKRQLSGENLKEIFVRVCPSEAILRMCQNTARFVLLLTPADDQSVFVRQDWQNKNTQRALQIVPESRAAGETDRLGNLMLVSRKDGSVISKLHKVKTKWIEILESYARIHYADKHKPAIATKLATRDYMASMAALEPTLARPDANLQLVLAEISRIAEDDMLPDSKIIHRRGLDLAEFAWNTLAEGWLSIDSSV